MIRLWLTVVCLWAFAALPVAAQTFSGLARLDVAQSGLEEAETGFDLRLYLSQPVPWRAFTVTEPERLVLDFREVDWRGASRETLLNADGATDLRFGSLRPGWSRMVVDLTGPLGIETAEMAVNDLDGTAVVTVTLREVSADLFASRSGAPVDPDWSLDAIPALSPEVPEDRPLIVAIDPGHGGIDPGAERDGVTEADLMLQLGLELAEAVARRGMLPVLTRQDDVFVSLADRITIARNAGADVFLSLHADALQQDAARGASVYLLSDEAQDTASERMAERHDRGDLLAGLDLSGQDDTIARILMDLARLETAPRSQRLSRALVSGLRGSGARLNSRPQRAAMLAVLLSADMPSVLVEAGFLSDDGDRTALSSTEGRAKIVNGLVAGLEAWALDDAALRELLRQ